MTRTLAFSVLLLLQVSEWFVNQYDPQANISSWIAGAAGAFVIRFAYPNLPIKVSVGGFFSGFILACLFAPTLVAIADANGFIIKPTAAWGTVGLIGDALIQLYGLLIRLTANVGNYTVNNPGEAFDSGIKRGTLLVELVAKIKDILPDSVQNLFKKP